jgi:NTE family protein
VAPTLPETLWRVVTLASVDTAEAARRHADLVIAPQADGVGLLEFHQLDRMRAEGRRAARMALETAPDLQFA